MSDRIQTLRDNLQRVEQRIVAATERANRKREEVCLVGVTKYVDAETTRALVEAGCHDLGESRPQVLWAKAEAIKDANVRWHQIGHLQRNKLRKTLPHVSLIHSVDSVRLLSAIDQLQAELHRDRRMPILLEVNVSGDTAKHGFAMDDLLAAMDSVVSSRNIELRGLMCMAGWGTSSDAARKDFERLRTFRDRLQASYPEQNLNELSMGMSADFEAAIAEGSTLVRVGSMLFKGLLEG